MEQLLLLPPIEYASHHIGTLGEGAAAVSTAVAAAAVAVAVAVATEVVVP